MIYTYDSEKVKQKQSELIRVVDGGYRWGKVQNDSDNNLLKDVIYNIRSIDTLNSVMGERGLTEDQRSYCVKRWLQIMISKMDEYLFWCNPNVEKNPDNRGDWDFSVDGVKVDLKSTQFPYELTEQGERIRDYLNNPEKTKELIQFFYNHQSKKVKDNSIREKYNSRLFVVCHSNFGGIRTDKLKTCFELKYKIFSEFCSNVTDNLGWCQWSDDPDSLGQVIYICETERGKLNSSNFVTFK